MSEREPGFYWVKSPHTNGWEPAELTAGSTSRWSKYPWSVIGSDEILSEEEVGEIGERIEVPNG